MKVRVVLLILGKSSTEVETETRNEKRRQPQPIAPNAVSIILRYSDDDHEKREEHPVPTSLEGENIQSCHYLELESTSSGNDETAARLTADLQVSYIPPERIVARFETKRFENHESKTKQGELLKATMIPHMRVSRIWYAGKMKAQANPGEKFPCQPKIHQNSSRPV
jgi:hypothetical protein